MHDQADVLYQEDVEMLRHLHTALAAGFPEEALVQLLRVYSDALGRVAEVETRLFRFYVRERALASGRTPEEYFATLESVGSRVNPLIEPAVLYFHRKGFIRGVREQVAWHLEEMLRGWKPAEAPGQMRAAVAFVDLASFTPLAEAMGDAAAAGVLERFGDIVRHAAGAWGGRTVKQIGDAFMLVFPEPRSALAAALEIENESRAEPQFPAVRSGIQWGSVLYREGDYVGSNVNIASRLATEANRHQILITSDVRREVAGMPDVEFHRLGKRRLKGLTGEIELFEARACSDVETERVADPVCGMELGPTEVAANLSFGGRDRAFCSEECLRRFVAAPAEYEAKP
jgi:class 3 adenylate cyclase